MFISQSQIIYHEIKQLIYVSRLFLFILGLSLISFPVQARADLEKVTLQLDWVYQYQFAGFIAAKEKGYYSEVGLDVELKEYHPEINIIDEVMSHRANYGIYNTSIVINENGVVPIALLATYMQRSPLVFVSSAEITTPHDFLGKRIMGTTDELQHSSLGLLLSHFDINQDNSIIVEHTFNADDFIAKRVDIMSAFRTNELYELDKHNVKYNIIDPADYGFYTSATNVFSTMDEVLDDPERTKRFINASNRGWAYAIEHEEEIIDLIYSKYSKLKSKEALRFEASATHEMMLLDLYPIGQINKELSLRTLKQLQQNALLEKDESLGTFLLDDIVRKYSQEVFWTTKERLYMQEKQEITMCVNPDWMPFEAIQDGEHIGIAADIFALFAERLPISIKLIETETWAESVKKVQDRTCDIFSLASETPTRKQFVDFTDSYVDFPIVMATKMDKICIENIEQVKNKKIGIVKGYAHAEILRNKIAGINIVDVDSITDGLTQVANGKLYGYIDNLMVIALQIQKQFTGELKISARLDEKVELGVGTRNDEPILNEIFAKLVNSIKEDEKQSIYNKWVSVKHETGFNYRLFQQMLLGFFIVVVAFLFHAYKVRQHNKSLKKLSQTDSLTQLCNRVEMDRVLLQQYENLIRYGTDCGIIILDIDYFKRVNDKWGHQMGDKILIEFADILRINTRLTDVVSRWGGEEFLIVCPHINIQKTKLLAEKLLAEIRVSKYSHGQKMTASCGVGSLKPKLSIAQNIEIVDVALYHAKKSGRDRVA